MTPSRAEPAITAMWVRDDAVDRAVDPDGHGYAPAAPGRLAAFALAGGLREVFLSAATPTADRAPGEPGRAPATRDGRGPVDAWHRDAVVALHDAGVAVSAVTPARGATTRWASRTASLAPVDRLQVVVEPWHRPAVADEVTRTRTELTDGVASVAAAGTGLPIDVCVPWWFAGHGDEGTGPTLLAAVAAGADRVVVAAPGAQAAGPGGVLDRAAPAAAALATAGVPFLVGVETDSPDVAGGAAETFWSGGVVAMIGECGTVAAELAVVPGFAGVAVRSHRTWRRLMGV